MNSKIYLIPGRNDKLNDFIGYTLSRMGADVYGRELLPPFSQLRFSDQIETIKKDLMSLFWYPEAPVLGDSYGGYLLLHSLAELDPFPGKVLLFSPVLGPAIVKNNRYGVHPPRAKRLLQLAKERKFPTPKYLEIHTGAEDKGCDPHRANQLGSFIPGSKVRIVNDQGHRLNTTYITDVISTFLGLSDKSLENMVELCLSDFYACREDELKELLSLALINKQKAMEIAYSKRRDLSDIPSSLLILCAAIMLEDTESYLKIRKIIQQEEYDAYSFQRDELWVSKDIRGPKVPVERLLGQKLHRHHDNELFLIKVRRTFPMEDLRRIDAEMTRFSIMIDKNYFHRWSDI